MNNYIYIKKIWWDNDLIEILVECGSPTLWAKNEFYTSYEDLKKLVDGLNEFLYNGQQEFSWNNGSQRGLGTPPRVSFDFSCKDRCGHIIIDVFMELNNLWSDIAYDAHFFVMAELGQLFDFYNKLITLVDCDYKYSVLLGDRTVQIDDSEND